ncbi:MAG: hypothetical protein E7015_03475 [Alphaproteobacteria bacterium]|nr:hypothetical protein [Alphaproteobacteria bacterium]
MIIRGTLKNIKKFSRDIFIVDKNIAEFSLESLNNCSIINALRVLYYKKKYNPDFFKLYCKDFSTDAKKYIQRIKISPHWKNCILIENVIAEYLYRKKTIIFQDNWLYVGHHETSGYRIIAGCGKGIILSRFISDDIFKEVINTKRYLRRLNVDEVKVFSNFHDFAEAQFVDLDDIFKMVDTDENITPVFTKNYNVIVYLLYMIIVILLCWISYNINECYSYDFSQFKLCNKIKTKNICVIAKSDNFDQLSFYLQKMKQLKFAEISDICKKYHLNVASLEIGKSSAKIQIITTKEQLQVLQKTFQFKLDERIMLLDGSNAEKATICLKLK